MQYEFLTPKTDIVLVYSITGKKEYEIILPEKIMPLSLKRGGFSDTNLYYKGAGIVYQSHFVNQCMQNERILTKSNIIYEKYQVCYPKLVGKFGIFMFPHQAVFSDFEGACGIKEMKILENQKHFELSAIDEITNVIPTGIENHNIFVYKLKKVVAEPLDVIDLIEYVLKSDYNTAWDKNLWSDIYCYRYIRDVADWFVSDKLCHKLGTVYALLNSLYNNDVYLYSMLLKKVLNVHNCERNFILYFSALIINKYCPKLFESNNLDVNEITPQLFESLLKLLFSGKACCHLENDVEWSWVREYYFARINKYVKGFSRKLISTIYFQL